MISILHTTQVVLRGHFVEQNLNAHMPTINSTVCLKGYNAGSVATASLPKIHFCGRVDLEQGPAKVGTYCHGKEIPKML